MRQKLQGKNKNIPADASQVCSSITTTLNEPKGTVCRGATRTCNNPEVNQAQRIGRSLKAFVYVISKDGKVVMPCNFAKAKRMVKKGAATLVKCYPFKVVQLNFVADAVQDVTLGIDSGYKHIGFSAVSSKSELLCGEWELDGNTANRLLDRKMYRRMRRNRHHWYRQARFNNRKGQELAPSVKRRYETHLRLIQRIKNLLPISKMVVETASFDIQQIQNPCISGTQYQQGPQLGFENVKQFVLHRDQHTCQHCGARETKLHVHHIQFRSNGGTDVPENLIALCEQCHKELHDGKFTISKPTRQYKAESYMSIVRNRFKKDIPDMVETFGYITKANRLALGIEKAHYNDAFCIANGTTQLRAVPITLTQKHRNNRVLQRTRKGYKPSIRRNRYSIQPGDLVKIAGKWYTTKGCHCKGKALMVNKKSISIKNVTKYFNYGGLFFSSQS